MATTMVRRIERRATPARWQAALRRALAEGVRVLQVAGSGEWVATSGTSAATAYRVAVSNGVAHGCDCPAGAHGDPVCKHRAAFYFLAGLLDLDPGSEPPAPAAPTLVACDACRGTGLGWTGTGEEVEQVRVACAACQGTGEAEAGDGNGDGDPEPSPASAPLPAGWVACGGCGRRGVAATDKPVPAGWRCPVCRSTTPPVVAPVDLAALGELLAA